MSGATRSNLTVCLLALLLGLGPSSGAGAGRAGITLSCWLPPTAPTTGVLEEIYEQAFAELGYDLVMHYRPGQRALIEAESGVTDGECVRVHDYLERHPDSNLTKVDVLLSSSTLEFWSRDPDRKVTDLSELQGSDQRIGYTEGMVAIEALAEHPQLGSAQPVPSTRHALKMLSAGRLDLYLGVSREVHEEYHQLDVPAPLYPSGELFTLKGYLYLHKRHHDLVDELADALRARLPADGL